MSRTDHVLEAIDGALEWDEESDAMRWAPPEEGPGPTPTPARRPALVRQPVRITLIVEQGDRVDVIDIPDPVDASYSMDREEEPEPYGVGLGYMRMPQRTTCKIGLSVQVGENGFTAYNGREHVAEVLRRFAEDGDHAQH